MKKLLSLAVIAVLVIAFAASCKKEHSFKPMAPVAGNNNSDTPYLQPTPPPSDTPYLGGNTTNFVDTPYKSNNQFADTPYIKR